MALSVKEMTFTESPQEENYSENALDKVVDPCTEFQLQYNSGVKSPNASFNLPTRTTRKYSLISLRGKLNYKVNDNELPRVHRTSSTQSVISMLRKENFRRNFSESSDYNGSDKTVLSSVPHTPYNCDSTSVRSLSSSGVCTPTIGDITSISPNAQLSPNYNQDHLETASNISLASNITDAQGSNISSVSDLTGYEEEFFQIKKLLINGSRQSYYRPEYPNTISANNSNDSSMYQHRIEELEAILQETRTENEQYKFKLKDLENKTELIWQEKFQELLRQKAQCEGQLQIVTKQYETALNEKEKILNTFKHNGEDRNSLRTDFTKLQLKLNSLEKYNSELNSKLTLSLNESKQWQSEFAKTESDNEKLRITLQELKSEIDSRNSVLFGLKNKITEQHMELQNHIQAKLKLNNHITTLNNEIDAIKKSEKWYIDQLHTCQIAKSNIQQELMSTQTNLITATQTVENTRMEVVHWKNMCEETQRKAMREKEKLLRKVEMIEADILEREAILKCTQDENETKIELNYLAKTVDDTQDYKSMLLDYEEQLANMKKIIQDQSLNIENQNKQITDYLVRITTLQKKLNEKEINTQTMENRNRDLEMKCNVHSENLRTKENELLELRNKIVNLEVTLHGTNREKQEIDEVVKNLREDFNKFMKCYQSMKERLEEKSKIINQFEHEKQELFMENNWRVCEIEELQHKVLDMKGLQAEIVELKNMQNQLLMEKDELLKENGNLTVNNDELITDCDHHKLKINSLQNELSTLQQHEMTSENLTKFTKDIANLENEILKLNEMLRVREDQLLNQTKNCEYLNCEIIDKEKIISDLKQKLDNSTNILERGYNKFGELQQCNDALQCKINDLHKKLLDANSVIEQFNTLCRNSELEKYNLAAQLNVLKTETELLRCNNGPTTNRNIETDRITKCNDSETQTDHHMDASQSNSSLESIKSKLLEIISENMLIRNKLHKDNDVDVLDSTDPLVTINEYLNQINVIKENQMKKLETSEKTNKILRAKLLKLKHKIDSKLMYLNERCSRLNSSFDKMHNILEMLSKCQNTESVHSANVSVQTQVEVKGQETASLMQEIKDLKTLLRVNEVERKEQYKRFETNNRTLLRKVKEHMRGRKTAEKNLSSLQDTYTFALREINNLKLLNNRQEIELGTFKARCDEYKAKCDKLNETIIELEREKGQTAINENVSECLRCLEKAKLEREYKELEYKYASLEEKIYWYEKEINDKEQGITECKKQLFNEKLQCSAFKKQVASIQMCLENANEQLDGKQIEFTQLKSMIEKLETNEKLLTDQLENAHMQYQDCKRKLETTTRMLEDKTAKDEILADEIKTLSCHLHQKTLELLNVQNTVTLLQSQAVTKDNHYQKTVDELRTNLTEIQSELESVQNDKFFLQRLCADLKMSLQGTLNQNKVLKIRLESLESETKDLTERFKYDSLPSLPSPSKIDEEYINRLLQQSTVVPDKPLKNLRSCLDSLKQEMATLQKEIIAKTQSDISL